MANTYTALATVTVGSGGAADIEFTSIPNTYTDLVLQLSLRDDKVGAGTFTGVKIQFNGSATGYSLRYLYGDGSSVASASTGGSAGQYVGGWQNSSANTASSFGSSTVYISNYAGSNNKSISTDSVSETNATAALAALVAYLWSDASAISSLKITCNSGGNWVQYSTATLYGIKNTV